MYYFLELTFETLPPLKQYNIELMIFFIIFNFRPFNKVSRWITVNVKKINTVAQRIYVNEIKPFKSWLLTIEVHVRDTKIVYLVSNSIKHHTKINERGINVSCIYICMINKYYIENGKNSKRKEQ